MSVLQALRRYQALRAEFNGAAVAPSENCPKSGRETKPKSEAAGRRDEAPAAGPHLS